MIVKIICDEQQELEYVQTALANRAAGKLGAGVTISDGDDSTLIPDEVTVELKP